VAALEEAIMEVAHLVAALAKSDGAVVMSRRYEVLGFGGEISGKLADVETVLRALDVEGEEFDEEPTRAWAPATVRPTACARSCRTSLRSSSPRTATSGSPAN
jgi:hypothetical protein